MNSRARRLKTLKHKIETVTNKRTRETYYKIQHPSGLLILIAPMENYSSSYALFGTKYGSINTKFKTDADKDFVTVPEGIAHYLEHKLFENEDCDAFALYAKTGASANAYTSFDKTCYLFSCNDNFEESLKILLDFVQKPYFTEETVRKEQGIIGQEIRMYDDNPGWRVFFNLLNGLYVNHPVRIDIAGTVESIAKIDADLLYRCYNTFYNLNNMTLSIAGNVDVQTILNICDKCLKPCENHQLETSFEDEPLSVAKNYVSQKLEVALPLFSIGFKQKPLSGKASLRAQIESDLLLSLLADESSELYRRMYDSGLINSTFSSEVFSGDGYFASMLSGESRDPKKVMDCVFEEIEKAKKNGLDKSRFEALKKSCYGEQIREFNNVEAVATNMINAAMDGIDTFDAVETIAEITLDDVFKRLDDLKPELSVLSVIEPK